MDSFYLSRRDLQKSLGGFNGKFQGEAATVEKPNSINVGDENI